MAHRRTNKELIEIWDKKNNSGSDYYIYERLTMEEKTRIFDLLAQNQGKTQYKKLIHNPLQRRGTTESGNGFQVTDVKGENVNPLPPFLSTFFPIIGSSSSSNSIKSKAKAGVKK